MNERCFVIQPFDDRGAFDKRFDDVLAPAIKSAELEPYRVDRDSQVEIPIKEIEKGIRSAATCLADITDDNPNVWFELGYAFAVNKQVALICSESRKMFPFDIQHRKIIRYKSESMSDFEDLKQRITERLKAIVSSAADMTRIGTLAPLSQTAGLGPHEVAALVSVMNNGYVYGAGASTDEIRNDLRRAGFSDTATSVALELLKRREFIVPTRIVIDEIGSYRPGYGLFSRGIDWLIANQNTLNLHYETPF